jgi:hypothetical protein
MALLGAALTLVALPGRALAQDAQAPQNGANGTSADATREAPGIVARMRARFDDLQNRGIHPKAGTIVSGSSFAFGVELRRDRFGGSPIGASVEGMWSLRGYQEYGAQIGLVEDRRSTLQLGTALANVTSLFNERSTKRPGRAAYIDVQYYHYPRVDFFGIGADAPVARTDFGLSGYSADGVVQWQATERFGLSARAGWLDVDLQPGSNDARPNLEDVFTPVHAPGLNQRARYITAGVGAAHDTRDLIGVPTRGTYVGAAVRQFMALNDDAPMFTRFAVDGRFYRALPTSRQVLAASVLASADRSTDTALTPFYIQYWLGGGRVLRGFPSYRFRGESLVHLSLEYRVRVAKFVEVVPFVDAGAAARRFADLGDTRMEVTPGIGIRARNDRKFFGRIDWARGPDGHRLIFSIFPPF